jgi:hypothetical protein
MSQTAAPQMAPARAEAAPARAAPAPREKPAAGNQALLRRLQAKLTIGATDDPLEREADSVAAHVMRMPASAPATISAPPRISRKCDSCEEEEKVQKKSAGEAPAGEAPASVEAALRTPGQAMDAESRAFFEPRFNADFSKVRIHDDGQGKESAAAIGARAYAVDNHIVLGPNHPAPNSPAYQKLLAHELTHVVQQSAAPRAVRRDLVDDAKAALDAVKKKAEDAAKQKLVDLGNSPVGTPSGYSGEQPKCGNTYCQPYASADFAAKNLLWAGPAILAGITLRVNPRVVPLWAAYMAGGSAPRDLTKDFGKDFTDSPSTEAPTQFLVNALAAYIRANFATVLASAAGAPIDFTPQLSAARAAIDDPNGKDQMNFNVPGDIPGNLAGGIGKDETKYPIGKTPSPFNDSREAKITAALTRNADGSLHIVPLIHFTVKDTIDLCPGDCGGPEETVATIPLSRFEASGLVGDVPFTVEFDGTAKELAPFDMQPPASKAPMPATTAAALPIHEKADPASKLVGTYAAGAKFMVICKVIGPRGDESHPDSHQWYKTDKGFVPETLVTLTPAGDPVYCDELPAEPTAPPKTPP